MVSRVGGGRRLPRWRAEWQKGMREADKSISGQLWHGFGVGKDGAMRWGQIPGWEPDKRPQLAWGTMKRNNSVSVFSA